MIVKQEQIERMVKAFERIAKALMRIADAIEVAVEDDGQEEDE